ncbi:hypothetical protein [Paraoerskovia marina]|uniref:Uncharacterized protein n=1 Tax=Paraoerskovia marina TaxID=545619 RepID=A0A1H1S4G5_9CELL|nr:hypothetical protein [Paraoerskovia marina]SDS42990.1 hypothetical protein SAMN04489860_1533 [Paraoerskovia marina]
MVSLSRLFSRRPSGSSSTPAGGDASRRATLDHLAEFVRTRVGVEVYVEPATNETPTTVLLVATTGEWTRRRVPDERTAHELARKAGVPVYDVRRTGYPQRYRDWNSQHRRR